MVVGIHLNSLLVFPVSSRRFEEPSAACISDMLLQVRDKQYLEVLCMAETFILLIEVFFLMNNDLEAYFFGQLQMF